MATKVHDDDEQDFAEVDIILAQAKRELRKQRRHMNLSDIPENFAHVPPSDLEPYSTSIHRVRPVSLDTSQPDFASLAGHHNHHPKLPILGIMAPMKWLRGYISCLVSSDDSTATRPHRRRRRRGSTS